MNSVFGFGQIVPTILYLIRIKLYKAFVAVRVLFIPNNTFDNFKTVVFCFIYPQDLKSAISAVHSFKKILFLWLCT